MILYEVSLFVKPAIFAEYRAWLTQHLVEMLQFDGFIEANVLLELPSAMSQDAQEKKLVVQYKITSEAQLDDYLQHHAAEMRRHAIDRFGDQFRAERKVWVVD